MRPLAAAISAGLCLLASFSPAGENGGAARAGAGPLAGLPSKPGPHVAKIKALGNGRWLDLGSPAPDPRWGKALGRSYSTRMVFLPGKRASFLAGQGVHAGMKKNGVYQDEIFAYDINAHRWICLYPGSDVNNLTLKLDAHGFEVDGKGEHVPVAILGHGHHLMTSDSHLGKVVIVPLGNTWWTKAFPRRKKWLDERAASWLRNPRHPWFYDVASGKWEHRFVAGEGPGPKRIMSVVEYLPSMKKTFLAGPGCKGWLYDYATNKWTAVSAPAAPLKGYDWIGCLDSRRERVMVGKGKELLAYCARSGKWQKCAPPPDPAGFGSSAGWTVTYDVASDAVVLGVFGRRSPGTGNLYFYDCASDKWAPKPAPIEGKRAGAVNAFYDPELNAHFFHVAGDSRDNGRMLVYRYRRAKPGESK